MPKPASEEEVVAPSMTLQQLWFELPQEERVHFGDCFSRMLLKAIETCRVPILEEVP
ncbi:MAG: hypothetical protein IT428_29170 [Planctomycetaceae bacterium]|nr:hypothetical protein [Planctomycetaceae bacterium]